MVAFRPGPELAAIEHCPQIQSAERVGLLLDIGTPLFGIKEAKQFVFEWRARFIVSERLGITPIDNVQGQDGRIIGLHRRQGQGIDKREGNGVGGESGRVPDV